MIFALNRSVAITLGITILVGMISGVAAAGLLGQPAQIWGARGALILFLNLLLIALGARAVLRFIHWISFAKHWWFPWLDGEWDAEIRSNWPRIKATMKAARSSGRFDPLTGEVDPDAEGGLTRATVTIRTSLLAIRIRLTPENTQRVSKTRFVLPRWSKPQDPELSYLFEQVDDGHIQPTDERSHFGAAHLIYDVDSDTLRGEYWTERRGESGINTAGTIVLRRRA